ncbi:hypothetical protein PABG_00071 [Paracoccidioides brasiliensis Pb03]|nr:hypothetical protein PABG_00071 [Paracoccidioides brasiliensis Pb03]
MAELRPGHHSERTTSVKYSKRTRNKSSSYGSHTRPTLSLTVCNGLSSLALSTSPTSQPPAIEFTLEIHSAPLHAITPTLAVAWWYLLLHQPLRFHSAPLSCRPNSRKLTHRFTFQAFANRSLTLPSFSPLLIYPSKRR